MKFDGTISYWLPLMLEPLKFSVPTARQFTLADLEPAPTEEDITNAFISCPWCDELGIAAESRVISRKEWQERKAK